MTLQAFLSLVVSELEGAGIRFMITGSLAASYHGAPRATQDVDLVVEPDEASLLELARRLRDVGLYASDADVREAVETRGQFNAIDPATGWKADFVVRKSREFSSTEFDRRLPLNFLGLEMSMVTAEDLVIAKLEWAKLGDSERQLQAVADIVAIQGERLDRDYLGTWIGRLHLEDQWEKVDAKGA